MSRDGDGERSRTREYNTGKRRKQHRGKTKANKMQLTKKNPEYSKVMLIIIDMVMAPHLLTYILKTNAAKNI